MPKLKRCPCGKIPKKLLIIETQESPKWKNCFGNCCAEWGIDFRAAVENKDEMELAIEAWNNAPRGFK
jgi:hypothetical protein